MKYSRYSFSIASWGCGSRCCYVDRTVDRYGHSDRIDDHRSYLDHVGDRVHRFRGVDHAVVPHVDRHVRLDNVVDYVDHGVDVCLDHVGNAVDHTAAQVVVHDRLDHVDDDHLDHVADTRIDYIVDHVDHGVDCYVLLDHVIDHVAVDHDHLDHVDEAHLDPLVDNVDHHSHVDDVADRRCRGNRSNRGHRHCCRVRNVDWYRDVYVVCYRDVVCRSIVVVRGT